MNQSLYFDQLSHARLQQSASFTCLESPSCQGWCADTEVSSLPERPSTSGSQAPGPTSQSHCLHSDTWRGSTHEDKHILYSVIIIIEDGDSLITYCRIQKQRGDRPQSVYSACTQNWKHRQRLPWAWPPGTDAPAASSLRFPLGQISQDDL